MMTGRAGRRIRAGGTALALLGAVSGCAFVPGGGPTHGAVTGAPAERTAPPGAPTPYALIPVTLDRAEQVNAAHRAGMQDGSGAGPARFFADAPPPPVRIEVGDTVEVSIVSTSESGFIDFANAAISPLSTTTLPAQQVDAAGRIHVPPAGRVRVAGADEAAVEARLAERLGRILIDPRVLLRVTDRAKARAAAFGEVADPGRFPLDPKATRLLDLLGFAGGPKGKPEELRLTLTRGGVSAALPLETALTRRAYNIRIWPGDVLRISPVTRRFVALGAVGRGGVAVEFAQPGYTLAQALSAAGGIRTDQADRRGVFLLRKSPSALLRGMGVTAALPGAETPTIYQFDLQDPATLFAAARFEMQDGDMVYVSDALITEIRKVLGIFSDVSGQYAQVVTIGG